MVFKPQKSALIKFENKNKFLACHAGIGPGMRSLQDINDTNRFEEPAMNGVLCDILWSDPRRKGCKKHQEKMFEHSSFRLQIFSLTDTGENVQKWTRVF